MFPLGEKDANRLPSAAGPIAPSHLGAFKDRRRRIYSTAWLLCILLLNILILRFYERNNHPILATPRCPQAEMLLPKKNAEVWDHMNKRIDTPAFKTSAVDWLAGAVRVPTESFDDMGDTIGVDPRWLVFGPFHEYLETAFPLVYTTLNLTKVNTYGLSFEWKGSDPSLKPLLLAAHQDVVPVEPLTVDNWKHPPFSGHFDGERIWGRGSSDDKSGLIGIMSAIETLIKLGFKPTRSVVLAFGFDEEATGLQGAGKISLHLEKIYGPNGISMIVDEGSGFGEQFGSIFATPAIGEKGYLDVLVEVKTPGGHSSIPPAHTGIGILSALLTHYEQHAPEATITREEPMYTALQCTAEHGKVVPSDLRKIISQSAISAKALDDLQDFVRSDKMLSSIVRTTQAIDIIRGGVKTNALPEYAYAIINHRIAAVSSLDDVKARSSALLRELAFGFNLSYVAFGSSVLEGDFQKGGSLTLSDAFDGGLEPAPITPTGENAAPYQLLSGTIKAVHSVHRSDEEVIVAPSMMSGNTDTQFYWKLSEHIFRYTHLDAGSDEGNIHTVDEYIEVGGFLEMIRFFTTLILNADESTTM